MKTKLKKYETCIKMLERRGLTRRKIAALIGIDEAVISRRMSGKQEPTIEARIVVNTLADVFEAAETGKLHPERGWFISVCNVASDVGRAA